MNLGYKYRLETTKLQKQLLFNHIFNHNQAFNILLNESEKQFQKNLKLKELGEKPKYLNFKEQDDLVKNILRNRQLKFNTKVVQQTRLEFNKNIQKTIKTFQSGKKSDKGMLKFKSSKSLNNQSFQTTKEQYKLLDLNDRYKILRLFNQTFKIRWSRDFPKKSEYKTITISFKDNQFYISFNVSYELTSKRSKFSKLFHKVNGDITKLNKEQLKSLKSYGMDININNIDLGNTKVHKKFNIENIKNDNLKKKYKKKLKLLQRKQSRRLETLKKLKSKTTKQLKKELLNNIINYSKYENDIQEVKKMKVSNNFYKTQNKINKINSKNTNKKLFNLHELVNEIILDLKKSKINHLVVEKLDVKSMTEKTTSTNFVKIIGKSKTKEMKKNILQISFNLFVNILKYKCALNEIYLELIDPKNTSKQCNNCGNIKKELDVTQRDYICNECNYENDRDYNSVLNILQKSIKYK